MRNLLIPMAIILCASNAMADSQLDRYCIRESGVKAPCAEVASLCGKSEGMPNERACFAVDILTCWALGLRPGRSAFDACLTRQDRVRREALP
jgi:hypothetical protein